MTYDLVWAIVDPRLTSVFHDVRLERTYVHHADSFDLLASETPNRLTSRNPGVTCQDVDHPQVALSPGEEAILESTLLVVRSSLDDVFKMAMQRRESLEH